MTGVRSDDEEAENGQRWRPFGQIHWKGNVGVEHFYFPILSNQVIKFNIYIRLSFAMNMNKLLSHYLCRIIIDTP